ncbi:MAG: hypothetical protein E7131_03595 [Rikenellaceae bacterium]|nr:hypothetical protein [Rikenellaceae bacterium]
MKKLAYVFVFLILAACGARNNQNETTQWPIEPKNESVELMLQLDSMNLALMGDSSSKYDTASQIYADQEGASLEQAAKVMKDTYREADEAWHKFVHLCNEDKVVEALNFYRENQANINIALSHSIVRFRFHDEVLGYLAYEALPEAEAQALMIEALEFDFMIFEAQLVVLNPDNETATTYFEYSYRMLRTLYHVTDRHDDMLTLIDRWFAVVEPNPSKPTQALIATRKAEVYYAKGDDEMSLKLLREAKTLLETELRNGGNAEYCNAGLEVVNGYIEKMNKRK